jgi:transposase-like protein
MRNAVVDKLLKEGRLRTVPDFEYTQEFIEEQWKKKEEARKEAQRIEQERIDKICCPSCKSTNKKHVVKSDSNGVCGPGYSSWITDEYFVCKDCGTRYEDLKKLNDD